MYWRWLYLPSWGFTSGLTPSRNFIRVRISDQLYAWSAVTAEIRSTFPCKKIFTAPLSFPGRWKWHLAAAESHRMKLLLSTNRLGLSVSHYFVSGFSLGSLLVYKFVVLCVHFEGWQKFIVLSMETFIFNINAVVFSGFLCRKLAN